MKTAHLTKYKSRVSSVAVLQSWGILYPNFWVAALRDWRATCVVTWSLYTTIFHWTFFFIFFYLTTSANWWQSKEPWIYIFYIVLYYWKGSCVACLLFLKKEEIKLTDFKMNLNFNLHKVHEIGRYKKVVTKYVHLGNLSGCRK